MTFLYWKYILVTLLKSDNLDYAEALSNLSKEVVISVCNNALKGNNITVDDLFDFVTVVPAGVVELAEKQFEGYAYIKP